MLALFMKGGIAMYPILLLSIISLAVFLERLITLRKEKFVPKAFEDQLMFLLKKKEIDEAKEFCKSNNSSLAHVSGAIISNVDLPLTRLLDVADEAGRQEMAKLDKFQQTLQTIVTIAPFLGLLGTVLGIMNMFEVIAVQGTGDAQSLSGGIGEALITTASGLIVAIPTQIFYHIVRARADSIGSELEKSSSKIMNILFKEEQG